MRVLVHLMVRWAKSRRHLSGAQVALWSTTASARWRGMPGLLGGPLVPREQEGHGVASGRARPCQVIEPGGEPVVGTWTRESVRWVVAGGLAAFLLRAT